MDIKKFFAAVVLGCVWIVTNGQDITFHIVEELRNSTFIGNVLDESSLLTNLPSNVVFSLIAENEFADAFRVHETTGDLFTNTVIDREVVCEFSDICMAEIQVVVKSRVGTYFHILKINVYINDKNDHAPVFSRTSITLTISESVLVGTSYSIPGARDRDTSKEYALKEYRLYSALGNDPLPFSIQFVKHLDGSSTVRLLVTEPLDREIKQSYELEIIATDGDTPPREGRLLVTVSVSDVNDNPPEFSSQLYNTTVTEETAVGSVVLRLTASDPDYAENGLIKYRFSTHQALEVFEHFNIEELSGEIKLKKQIVFSPGKVFNIIAEAYDNPLDGQSMSTQTLVKVNVENSGNNAPIIVINILTKSGTAEVTENASIGTVIAYVVVEDHDVGAQGMATCIIEAIDFEIQRIDINRYKIYVDQQLDYERTKSQNITVHCQDNGDPPLPASSAFTVFIKDYNDHEPVFLEDSYSANVREDKIAGEFILDVTATDIDTGNNSMIDFEVVPEYSNMFYFEMSSLKPNTAKLKLGSSLDRETKSSYIFPIYAKDRGVPSKTGTSTVKIYITDVNDERANFTKNPFQFYVLENLAADAVVGRVTATDRDLGINQQLEFYMHPDFVDQVPFVVFADGMIKTNRELDREKTDRYDFKVIASDKGENPQSSTGTVVIRVSDANDMAPQILFPKLGNNTIVVAQSTPAWQIVSRVIARDNDEIGTSNSRLAFSIEGRNDSNLFQINPNTGEIQVTKALDVSDIGKIYRLEFFVKDHGKPKEKSAETVMYIRIKSNDATNTAASTNVLSNKNFLIAIIVAVVTVVLSVGIVATIFIIRRIDRERKDEQRRKANTAVVDPDINAKQVFDGSITVFSLPSEDSLLEKKKKEVSFSLEDDVFSDDDLIQKNGIDGNHRPYKPNLAYLAPGPGGKKVEDNHSETSGDTGTSDSGRGGSDEEIHTSMSQSPRDKMMDFSRPLPQLSHQEIIPFSFKKGLSAPYSARDYNTRTDSFSCADRNNIEMSRHELDSYNRPTLSTMAVHLPNDTLDRSRNKVVLLQTDSGIHSDTNSNEGDNNVRDCMV